MKLVIAINGKHEKHLLQVPDYIYLFAGDYVGAEFGTGFTCVCMCLCDTFNVSGDKLETISKLSGYEYAHDIPKAEGSYVWQKYDWSDEHDKDKRPEAGQACKSDAG